MIKHLDIPPLTHIQMEIITGSLLGDASIWYNKDRKNGNEKFTKGQSFFDVSGHDKHDYMQWHITSLQPYSNENLGYVTSHSKYKGYIFTTHCHSVFTNLAKKWYAMHTNEYVVRNNKRIKIVPHDLRLTPLALCVWYMDDGSASAVDGNITLHTQGFTWDECEFLSERLRLDLNITSKVRAKDGHQIIYVPLKSYFDFINIIKPYVEWNCFKHKIDMETYNKKPQIGETHSQATFTNSKIKQLVQLHKQGWSHEKLSKKFRTAKANISLILSGSHWSHITGIQYKPTKPRMGEEVKRQIVELSQVGLTQKEIAKTLKVNQSTVSRTIKGAICQTSVT